jgi:hypothetical protein
MGRTRNKRSGAASGGVLLSLIALVMLVIVPPGFMASANGSAAGLVICSGHGPLTLSADGRLKPLNDRQSPKSRPDAPCAFAGHGVAATPTPVAVAAPSHPSVRPEPFQALADRAPGRGLAAPPPPSQAPPATSLI